MARKPKPRTCVRCKYTALDSPEQLADKLDELRAEATGTYRRRRRDSGAIWEAMGLMRWAAEYVAAQLRGVCFGCSFDEANSRWGKVRRGWVALRRAAWSRPPLVEVRHAA